MSYSRICNLCIGNEVSIELQILRFSKRLTASINMVLAPLHWQQALIPALLISSAKASKDLTRRVIKSNLLSSKTSGNNLRSSSQFICPRMKWVIKHSLKSFLNNTPKTECQWQFRWTRCLDHKDGCNISTASKLSHGSASWHSRIPKEIIVGNGRMTPTKFNITSAKEVANPWES